MKQKSLFVSHKIIPSFNIHSMQLCVRVEIEIYRFLKVKKKDIQNLRVEISLSLLTLSTDFVKYKAQMIEDKEE